MTVCAALSDGDHPIQPQRDIAKAPSDPAQRFACHVINLDGSDGRMARIAETLVRAGIAFERQPAVDGRGFGPGDVPAYDARAAELYMGRQLVGGELGCYLSHIDTAERFLASAAPTCLVLEDDADPPTDLGGLVTETIAALDAKDPSWRIVNLGNPRIKITKPVTPIDTDLGRHELVRAYYFPMTTSAILWSRKGAEDFLAAHRRIFAPVDNYLRHWITRAGGGYAFRDSPVPTFETGSEIAGAAGTGSARSRHGRTLAYGWRKQRRLMGDKAIALWHKHISPSG